MSRWAEMESESWRTAIDETQSMKVLKYLPDNQRTVVRHLISELVRFERFNDEPEFQNDAKYHLFSAIIAIQKALEAEVPQEIILAVLDREVFKPKPAKQAIGGKTGGG